MFNLRGFSANNSLFVDGVRDDGLISRDVFNLEQVDVFLGPTGTDVGRGTAAGYVNMHVQNFLDCMDSRQAPRSDVEIGHNSMIACHLGNIAFRLGRRVSWDVDKEQIAGDPEAQKLVVKPYRAPWSLPPISSATV